MKEEEASSTALTVAHGILFRGRQRQFAPLVSHEELSALESILKGTTAGRKRLAQLDSSLFTALAPLVESMMVPGITVHYILRKRTIEDYVTTSIAQGVTQVVNLGAGFDTLCYRLSGQHAGVNFFEIDHPATSALKTSALAQLGDAPSNLTFLTVDFTREKSEEKLSALSAFDPSRPTLYICEGVMVYLDEAEVKEMLTSLKRMTGAGTRFIFTYSPASESGYGLLLKLYLLVKQEPLNWKIETIDLGPFLAANDYSLLSVHTPADMRKNYLSPDYDGPTHTGECVAIAEVDG